jgi:hypothetical protein
MAAIVLQAHAQPKLPAAPDPKLPTMPEVPAMPAAPATAPKAAAPEPGDEAEGGAANSGTTPPAAPQGPSAVVDGPAREVEIQIDDKQKASSDDLPASLPKALRNSARPKGAKVEEPAGAGGQLRRRRAQSAGLDDHPHCPRDHAAWLHRSLADPR